MCSHAPSFDTLCCYTSFIETRLPEPVTAADKLFITAAFKTRSTQVFMLSIEPPCFQIHACSIMIHRPILTSITDADFSRTFSLRPSPKEKNYNILPILRVRATPLRVLITSPKSKYTLLCHARFLYPQKQPRKPQRCVVSGQASPRWTPCRPGSPQHYFIHCSRLQRLPFAKRTNHSEY